MSTQSTRPSTLDPNIRRIPASHCNCALLAIEEATDARGWTIGSDGKMVGRWSCWWWWYLLCHDIYIYVDNMLIYVMIYVMIYVDNGYEYVDHWWYSMMKSFIYHFQISQKGFSETTNPLVIHCYLETETQLGRGAAPPCLVWPSESFDAVRWASCDSHRLHWRANKRVKHGETRRAPGRVTIDV